MLRIVEGSAVGVRLVSERAFSEGEVVAPIAGQRVLEEPTRFTLQIGECAHLSELGSLTFLNHSCRPNLHLDTARLVAVAARDIEAGEELTFFYPSTEWDMSDPFPCQCGFPECLGAIAGARHLPAEAVGRYFLNPHILELLRREGRSVPQPRSAAAP